MTDAEHKIVAEIEDNLREEVAAWRVIHAIERSDRTHKSREVMKLKSYIRHLRQEIDKLFIELRQVDITDVLDGKWDKWHADQLAAATDEQAKKSGETFGKISEVLSTRMD